MPAFEAAIDLGYRWIETDAHVTADGICLAFHDEVLDRVTDRTGTIAELPYREVRQARVEGREPIPLMEDLLAAFDGVRINIDPKHDAAVEPLAAAIERAGATARSPTPASPASGPGSGSACAPRWALGPSPGSGARAWACPPAGPRVPASRSRRA